MHRMTEKKHRTRFLDHHVHTVHTVHTVHAVQIIA